MENSSALDSAYMNRKDTVRLLTDTVTAAATSFAKCTDKNKDDFQKCTGNDGNHLRCSDAEPIGSWL